MSQVETRTESALVDRLAADGYWVAIAVKRLSEGKYADAIALCRENLESRPDLVSGRLVYAQALFRSGQAESAAAHFRRVLALDPVNIVALKYLGDIAFEAGDVVSAMSNYGRILEIDPFCRGLRSDIVRHRTETTRTITLTRRAEAKADSVAENLREIPFYTETIGDLYLAQGYPRLAARVFRKLSLESDSPRITEKLSLAESKKRDKDD
ncbi:MAG: tetratricopeptide repeat protein [Candidatus Zixiibacteriota bacterium]